MKGVVVKKRAVGDTAQHSYSGNRPTIAPESHARLLGVALDSLRARLPYGWEVQVAGPQVAPTKQRYDGS